MSRYSNSIGDDELCEAAFLIGGAMALLAKNAGGHPVKCADLYQQILANMPPEEIGNFIMKYAQAQGAAPAPEPAAPAAPTLATLRRFAIFESEDGIYEHKNGSYVLYRDVAAMLGAADTHCPIAGETCSTKALCKAAGCAKFPL